MASAIEGVFVARDKGLKDVGISCVLRPIPGLCGLA
jgi:hypothetical protein